MQSYRTAGTILGLVWAAAVGGSLPAQTSPVPAVPATEPAKPMPLPVDFSDADAAAKKYMQELKLPGAGLYVAHEGVVLHEKYFGEYTRDTVIPIASSSKWLSGAVIMALVDDGVLSLDTPIGEYMPELPKDKQAITIRQLFSHTSGLPSDVTAGENWLISMETAAQRIGEAELLAKPGAEFRYGQSSMQLAAAIACKVTGKTWHELFEAKIAGPCSMKDTNFGRRGKAPNPLVAGGAFSTLRDYANFLTMIANKGTFGGKRVLSEKAVAEMLKDQIGAAKKVSAALMRMVDGSGYGIGNWVDRKDAKGITVESSSPGAFGFVPWVDQERKIVGVWMICDRERESRKAMVVGKVEDPRKAVNKAVDAAIARFKPASPAGGDAAKP